MEFKGADQEEGDVIEGWMSTGGMGSRMSFVRFTKMLPSRSHLATVTVQLAEERICLSGRRGSWRSKWMIC